MAAEKPTPWRNRHRIMSSESPVNRGPMVPAIMTTLPATIATRRPRSSTMGPQMKRAAAAATENTVARSPA